MVMYKSLNKIVDDFKIIVEHHKLLGSDNFFFGDPADLSELNIKYPYVIMQSIPFTTSENSIDYKFRLYLMDIVDEDLSNYRDVLSDQIQIFNDILNRLENYSDYYTVSTKNSINPFNQKFDDHVGGIWTDIQYTTGRINSKCDAPFDDFLFDTDGNIITESNRFNILLNDLADISLENLQNGQSLVYSGGTWINSDVDNLEYWRLSGNELTTLEEYLIKVNDIQALNNISVEGNLDVSGNTTLTNVNITDSTEVNYVKFNETTDNSYEEGKLFYENNALNLMVDNADVLLQIGEENWVKCKNAKLSDIQNGQVVYVSGSTGDNLKIDLANANDTETHNVIGVATHNINSNSVGYITTFGRVSNIDTSIFEEGDELWLSTTDGEMTNERQADDICQIFIGYVIRKHATEGSIFVNIEKNKKLDHLSDVDVSSSISNQFLKKDIDNVWKGATIVKSDISDFDDGDYVSVNGDTVNGDLIIEGNLYVSGDTTTVNTENLNIRDNIILLNSGETGSGVVLGSSGIEIDRGSLDNQKLIFDESDDNWKIGTGSTLENIATENYVDTNVYNSEDTQLIFNNNGILSGDSILTWNGAQINLGNQVINQNGYIKMSSRIESGFFTNYITGKNIKFLGKINEGFTFGNRWAISDTQYFTNVDGDGNWYIYDKTSSEQTPDVNFKLKVDGNTLFTDTYIDTMSGQTENYFVGVDGDGKLYRTEIDVNQEEFDLIDYIVLSEVSENQSFQLPSKFQITSIVLEEISGSTISGVSIGTSSATTEVVNIEDLSVGELKEVEVGKGVFSSTEDTTLYIHADNWTSEINVHIRIEKFTE